MTDKKHILKSASIISLVTIVSRVLGYVRDQRITLLLGTSAAADAYVLAYRIPNLFRRLVAEGSMTASFIPVFTTYMSEKSKEEVWDFANKRVTRMMPNSFSRNETAPPTGAPWRSAWSLTGFTPTRATLSRPS